MKLYINKTTVRGTKKVTLVISESKKAAQEVIGQKADFDILDNNPDLSMFHDGCGSKNFELFTALPKDETEFVQVYGASNLPN